MKHEIQDRKPANETELLEYLLKEWAAASPTPTPNIFLLIIIINITSRLYRVAQK